MRCEGPRGHTHRLAAAGDALMCIARPVSKISSRIARGGHHHVQRSTHALRHDVNTASGWPCSWPCRS